MLTITPPPPTLLQITPLSQIANYPPTIHTYPHPIFFHCLAARTSTAPQAVLASATTLTFANCGGISKAAMAHCCFVMEYKTQKKG